MPSPRPAPDAHGRDGEALGAARAVLAQLPERIRPGRAAAERLAPAVADALASGWTPDALAEHLAADLPERIVSVRGLLARRLEDLPAGPPTSRAGTDRRPVYGPRCNDPRHDPETPDSDRFLYDPEDDQPIGICPCARPLAPAEEGVR